MDKRRAAFVETLRTALAQGRIGPITSHTDLTDLAAREGWSVVPLWFRSDDNPMKIGRGRYDLSSLMPKSAKAEKTTVAPATPATPATPAKAVEVAPAASIVTQSLLSQESTIPERDADFIEWGHFDDVKTIIGSSKFYPVFVTGLSGNGKTTMIQQACAATGRECYRINITAQTDEDDLLGGFRLINGETVWFDGPVIQAMKAGAILLLDEVDSLWDDVLVSLLRQLRDGFQIANFHAEHRFRRTVALVGLSRLLRAFVGEQLHGFIESHGPTLTLVRADAFRWVASDKT